MHLARGSPWARGNMASIYRWRLFSMEGWNLAVNGLSERTCFVAVPARAPLADSHVSSLTWDSLPFLSEAECQDILQYLTNTETHGRRHGVWTCSLHCECAGIPGKKDWREYAQDYRVWVPVFFDPSTINAWCRGLRTVVVRAVRTAASGGAYTKIGRCREYFCWSNY